MNGIETESKESINDQITIINQTKELKALFTVIRDKNTNRNDFVFYSDRIIRILLEEAINHLPFSLKTITTPSGSSYHGRQLNVKICGVSIMRAGEAMEHALRDCCRCVRIGKILIQRDEYTALPKYYYSKLPPDVASRYCLLMDPMLGTGGSAKCAIQVLLDHGVLQNQILFVSMISAPEGISAIRSAYPKVKIITASVDDGLDERKFIIPGLGDFGCRYFGTDVASDDDMIITKGSNEQADE